MPTHAEIDATIEALGLTMEATHVPWDKSRSAGEKLPKFEYRISLRRGGREVLACDYGMGCGHSPLYPKSGRLSAWDMDRLTASANGKKYSDGARWQGPPKPTLRDVLYSLTLDAGVLDSPTYEDWASDYGYDPDSRKGEATYRACLEGALKLRAAIGEEGLASLRLAFEDY